MRTWPTAPTRRTRNNKSCRGRSVPLFTKQDYRRTNTDHTTTVHGNHRPVPTPTSGGLETPSNRHKEHSCSPTDFLPNRDGWRRESESLTGHGKDK
nr:MAG TPA: hypothetical protein [Caudoviricetes sp.]